MTVIPAHGSIHLFASKGIIQVGRLAVRCAIDPRAQRLDVMEALCGYAREYISPSQPLNCSHSINNSLVHYSPFSIREYFDVTSTRKRYTDPQPLIRADQDEELTDCASGIRTEVPCQLLLYIFLLRLNCFFKYSNSQWYFSAQLLASRALPPPSSAHAPVPS